MSFDSKLLGEWKGQYSDANGWNCRLTMTCIQADDSIIGRVRVEEVELHGVSSWSFEVMIEMEAETVSVTAFPKNENLDLSGFGKYVDTSDFFRLACIFGVTPQLEINRFRGGTWIIWKLANN